MSDRKFRQCHAFLFALVVILAVDFASKQAYVKWTAQKGREKPEHRQPSRLFHHALKPMTSREDHFGPLTSMYHVNSLGMRDASCHEIPLKSPRPRILIVGDSFVEGIGVSWEESFVGRLAVALDKRGVEVLNAGVASYAPTIYDTWVTHLIRDQGLEVDQVLVFIDISDIKDEHYYHRQEDGSIRYEAFGPVRAAADKMARAEYALDWVETHVEGNFVILGALVRNLRLAWLKSPWAPWYVRAEDEIPQWGYDWGEYRGPYEPYVEEGLGKAKVSMDRLAEFLRQKKIPLTVVVYPWPAQIRRGREDSRVVTEWKDWAAKQGTGFLSLFPLFLRAGPAGEVIRKYHHPGDPHWNAEGNALVARELIRRWGEISGRKAEDRGRMTEGGGQRTDDGRRRTEDG